FPHVITVRGWHGCSIATLLLPLHVLMQFRSAIAEAWRKRRYEAAFIAKLNECESESAETQTWIEFAVKCNYIDIEVGRELHQTYIRVLSGLVNMINHPSPWLMKQGENNSRRV
ncbi:MAG: hypothetical protein BRC45_01830, partial [Cyanobacteria bacterium QS_5_48_63]